MLGAAAAAVLALVALFMTEIFDPICQVLPLWLQRHARSASFGGLVLVFACLSAFVGALGMLTRHHKRWRLLVGLLLLELVFVFLHFQLNAPILGLLRDRTAKDGSVLQSCGASCGAASVANLVRGSGLSVSETDAAELMGVTRRGSSPGQIRYALATYGVEFTTLNSRTLDLRQVTAPAILFIDHPAVGSEGHAVVYLGLQGEQFLICDPLVGKNLWPAERAETRWHGNGIECRQPARDH